VSVALRSHAGRAAGVLRAIAGEVRDKDVAFMARSVAFSAFLSMVPLLLLLLILATAVGGETLAGRVQALTRAYLTPAAQGLVGDALTRAASRLEFSLFGLPVLLWGAQGMFRGLDVAFSRLYAAPRDEGILDQLKDAVVVFVAITVATVAMVVLAVGLRLFEGAGAAGLTEESLAVLGIVVLIGALSVAFFPLYYVFPDVSVSAREVLPGTLLTAVGWTALQAGFQLYVEFSATNQLYGAIGGVILLLTWLYLGAAMLLVGGAVNVVLAGRHRAKTATVPESPAPQPQ